MPQLQSLPSPRLLVLESNSFSKPSPPKPCMQEYASTSQLHLSKPSCHESKSFLKPPPQNPTCKSMPQPHSFTSPRLLVTSPSHFLNLPPPPKPYMQEYASTSQLHLSKTSCHDSKSFSKPSPPKTLHARVFLNFTASPNQDFLSRLLLVTIPSHFLNLPPPKPYMQEYSSTSQPPLSKTSC